MIAFNRPAAVETALPAIRDVLASQKIGGNGAYGQRVEKLLEAEVGTRRALLTTSCTHALEMTGLLLDLVPGDEVIVPAFTFVSTLNAYVLRGAKPVFADIRPDTLDMDEAHVASLVTTRTKAIVPVHYGGVACEMDAITAAAASVGAVVVEDNAHGLFGRYRVKQLGTLGALATQSFHETKNFTCGEGGALFVNDARLAERAEIIREKGTDRAKFFRGEVDKYTWRDVGSSYVLSDLLAALLHSQLEARAQIQERRMRIWNRYATELAPLAARGLRLPVVPAHCEHTAHLFYLLVPSERRGEFISHMRERDVQTVFHYQPLHLSAMGEKLGGRQGMCPVTEKI